MVTPVAMPVVAPMVATEVAEEVQLPAAPASRAVDPSLKVAKIFNWLVEPLITLGEAGATAIAVKVALSTVSVVEPVTVPTVAVMTELPAATPVATPLAVMVATAVVPELQVTAGMEAAESTRVLPFVYVAVAVNCSVAPAAIFGVAGVTVTVATAGAVTVMVTVLEMPPEAAVITEVPVATAVAKPPAVMVATEVVAEVQVTVVVTVCVAPSL